MEEESNVYVPAADYQSMADEQIDTANAVKQNEENAATQEADRQTESQQAADPRSDGVGFNAGDITSELGAAFGGGIQDTASSIATLPERAADMFNGEMEKAGDDYKPDWDPFTNHDDPIETKTWWGGAIRGVVHFAGLAVGTVAAAKGIAALGIGAGVSATAGWVAGAARATTLAGTVAKGAAVGAIGDVVSRNSQDDNIMGQIANRQPHHPLQSPR